MKKLYIIVVGLFLLAVFMAAARAWEPVDEQNRDPGTGYSNQGTFSWVEQTAHYNDGTPPTYTQVCHYYDKGTEYYDIRGRQYQSSDPYHPYTEQWVDAYIAGNWCPDTHAIVQW